MNSQSIAFQWVADIYNSLFLPSTETFCLGNSLLKGSVGSGAPSQQKMQIQIQPRAPASLAARVQSCDLSSNNPTHRSGLHLDFTPVVWASGVRQKGQKEPFLLVSVACILPCHIRHFHHVPEEGSSTSRKSRRRITNSLLLNSSVHRW